MQEGRGNPCPKLQVLAALGQHLDTETLLSKSPHDRSYRSKEIAELVRASGPERAPWRRRRRCRPRSSGSTTSVSGLGGRLARKATRARVSIPSPLCERSERKGRRRGNRRPLRVEPAPPRILSPGWRSGGRQPRKDHSSSTNVLIVAPVQSEGAGVGRPPAPPHRGRQQGLRRLPETVARNGTDASPHRSH